ncbi:MAG: hypothetical protein IPJ81_17435 [Chitinophagaceae bacterium]|nr:hypothetical protein [Chitinophagaceae bacterium]
MRKIKIFIPLFIFLCSQVYGQNIPNGQFQPAVPAQSVNPVPAAYSNTIPQNYIRTWTAKMPTSDVSKIVSSTQVKM